MNDNRGYSDYLRNGAGVGPCQTNLSYLSNKLNPEGTLFLDKSKTDGVPNDNDAAILSNSVYFNGVDSTCEIQFSGNALFAIDKLTIWKTTDNNVAIQPEEFLTDANDPLFYKDLVNNKLVIGTNGTNFWEGWINAFSFEIDGNQSLKIPLVSGTNDKEYNINISEEQYYVNSATPYGILDGALNLNGENLLTGGK